MPWDPYEDGDKDEQEEKEEQSTSDTLESDGAGGTPKKKMSKVAQDGVEGTQAMIRLCETQRTKIQNFPEISVLENPNSPKGVLPPEEIKEYVPDKLVEKLKERFLNKGYLDWNGGSDLRPEADTKDTSAISIV